MSQVRIVFFTLLFFFSWSSATSQAEVLRKISPIRGLSPEEAHKHLPVHVLGMIIDAVPSPNFFLQDKTGGIYVIGAPARRTRYELGDIVELDGYTEDSFAPIVYETGSRKIGSGKPAPAPLRTMKDLAGGRLDSQWIRLEGVVRSQSIDTTSWKEPALHLSVAGVGGVFQVRVPLWGQTIPTNSYIGQELSVEGICGSLSNADHQFTGVIVYVPKLSFLSRLKKHQDATIDSLLRFSPSTRAGQRLSVQGTVTYVRGDILFLASAGSGLRVQTEQDYHVTAGDFVKAEGYPEMGDSRPVLKDAVITRLGRQEVPAPVILTISPPFERFDGVLVTARAKVLKTSTQLNNVSLMLEDDRFVFTATLESDGTPVTRRLQEGSTIAVTGICVVRNDGIWHTPASFTILLPSADDITILEKPAWWSTRHTAWLAGLILAIVVMLMMWNLLLHDRLKLQVDLYKQKLHSGAILEERARIARELHDSLEQELAGVVLRLDLAADCFETSKPLAKQAIDDARAMSRRGMLQARKSVWDMRCDLLERGDLEFALRQLVEELRHRSKSELTFAIRGETTALSQSAELNVLRIAQEALVNSLKHAKASRVEIVLEWGMSHATLKVSDNGTGFDPRSGMFDGHFGLVDMEERAKKVGSTLKIVSSPEAGTSIEVAFAVTA